MLGPLPFLIYINDIYASAPDVSFHLLADDTCLLYSNKNLKTETNVNVVLNNISNWLKANKLTLNVKKNNHLLIFSINNNNKMQIKLFIDIGELEQKDNAKYFRINFNSNLTWNKHRE